MKKFGLGFLVLTVALALALPGICEVKTYTVNKVKSTAPKIDGNFTEEEWAGSVWTGEFYGLDNGANTILAGQKTDLKYQWRALWDDEYFYFLLTADLEYLNPNGKVWLDGSEQDLTDLTQVMAADDTGYAGWNTGQCIDFEIFVTPNWTDAIGNDVDTNPPNYQICYFPVKEGLDPDGNKVPSNFGVRGLEGPPFFFSGLTGAADKLPATAPGWNPIADTAAAQAVSVKPFMLAAQPHEVAGAKVGTDVVAKPVLEIAFPYSQFGLPALVADPPPIMEDFPPDWIFYLMKKDANGKYVKAGDKWLINVAAYTDGVVSATGLTLITWNLMDAGGFHMWPKGIMTFATPVGINDWMLN